MVDERSRGGGNFFGDFRFCVLTIVTGELRVGCLVVSMLNEEKAPGCSAACFFIVVAPAGIKTVL